MEKRGVDPQFKLINMGFGKTLETVQREEYSLYVIRQFIIYCTMTNRNSGHEGRRRIRR